MAESYPLFLCHPKLLWVLQSLFLYFPLSHRQSSHAADPVSIKRPSRKYFWGVHKVTADLLPESAGIRAGLPGAVSPVHPATRSEARPHPFKTAAHLSIISASAWKIKNSSSVLWEYNIFFSVKWPQPLSAGEPDPLQFWVFKHVW